MALLWFILPSLLLPQTATPQSPQTLSEIPRKRVSGRVLRNDNKAWQNAQVILFSRSIPENTLCQETDSIAVNSDSRGRFRASVLVGRSYSVWAQSEQTSTSYLLSNIQEDVIPGRPIRLIEAAEKRHRLTLEILGRAAWKDLAPLSFRVASHGTHNYYSKAIQLDQDGQCKLPMMPDKGCFLEVHGKNNYPIFFRYIPSTKSEWQNEKLRAAPDGDKSLDFAIDPFQDSVPTQFKIPPPHLLRILVSSKAGKPVPQASVLRELEYSRLCWLPIGKTDKSGILIVPIPGWKTATGDVEFQHLLFMARAPKYSDNYHESARRITAIGKNHNLKIELGAGYTVKGRVMLAKGKPASHLPLLVYSSLGSRGHTTQIAMGPFYFETDADGRFELPGRAEKIHYRLVAVPTEAQRRLLPREPNYPLAREILLHVGIPDSKTDLGEIRMDQLLPLDISISNPDSGPADGALLLYAEASPRGQLPRYPVRMRANRRGKLRMLVPRRTDLMLFACSEAGIKTTILDLSEGKESLRTVSMQLCDEHAVSGRVCNGEGSFIADATVELTGMHSRAHGSLIGQARIGDWMTIRMIIRALQDRVWKSFPGGKPSWFWRERRWAVRAYPMASVSVDKSGNFRFLLPGPDLQLQFVARRIHGGRRRSSSESTIALGREKVQGVEIMLDSTEQPAGKNARKR